jgi:hypothetical protein
MIAINAGYLCLAPGEDHWEALGRRSDARRFQLISLYMNRLSTADRNKNWEETKKSIQSILDVDSVRRRSPLNLNVSRQNHHRFAYEQVNAIDKEYDKEEDGVPEAQETAIIKRKSMSVHHFGTS